MAPPTPLNWFTGGDILLTNSTFTSETFSHFIVAHELGHVWDWRESGRLHQEMSIELETRVCVFNPFSTPPVVCWFDVFAGKEAPPGNIDDPYAGSAPWEDWADSFGTYVVPGRYSSKTDNPLGPIREAFIREKIDEIP
jgi:hypothetical protein